MPSLLNCELGDIHGLGASYDPSSYGNTVEWWDRDYGMGTTMKAAGRYTTAASNPHHRGSIEPHSGASTTGYTLVMLYRFGTAGTPNQGRCRLLSLLATGTKDIATIYHDRTGGSVYRFTVKTYQNGTWRGASTSNYTAATFDQTWVMIVARIDDANTRTRVEVYTTAGATLLDTGWVTDANIDGTYSGDPTTAYHYVGGPHIDTGADNDIQNPMIYRRVLSDAEIVALLDTGSFYDITDLPVGAGSGPADGWTSACEGTMVAVHGSDDMTAYNSPALIDGVVEQKAHPGNPVQNWTGAEAGYILTQSDITKQPIYTTDALGVGQNGVVGDGVDDQLELASFTTIAQPWTLAFQVHHYAASGLGCLFAGDNPANKYIVSHDGAANGYWVAWTSSVTAGARTLDPEQHTIAFNGASSYYRVDGAEKYQANHGTGDVDGLILFSRNVAGQWLEGALGHIVLMDAVPTGDDLTDLEGYLAI